MAKGSARSATAATAILQQAAAPQPVEEPEYKPAKRGVNAGLRQGETRITCIYRKDQSQVLHDWAKTTGRTFREVCLAMASRYIEEVIRPATSGDHKLINTGDVPEAYADMYDAETPDEWAQFFK